MEKALFKMLWENKEAYSHMGAGSPQSLAHLTPQTLNKSLLVLWLLRPILSSKKMLNIGIMGRVVPRPVEFHRRLDLQLENQDNPR